jgi:hypothetical protein
MFIRVRRNIAPPHCDAAHNVCMTQEKTAGRGPTDRRGPIERALSIHDRELLISTVQSRSTPDANGCWLWDGARGQNGYAYSGRVESRRIVSRIVGWADAGFPGDLKTFPPVGHSCGRRPCVNPAHLSPVTSHLNALEAKLRNALMRRIHALENAIRVFDPTHTVLAYPELKDSAESTVFDRGTADEHPAGVIRRLKNKGDFEESRRQNQLMRLDQVVAVRKHREAGLNIHDALAQEGPSRAVFDTWKVRLDKLMQENDRS